MRLFSWPIIIAAVIGPGLAAPALSAAEPAGEHGGGSKFPPFDGSTFTSQLFWLAIAFGVLYWLMKTVALPRIGTIIEERQSRIDSALAAAAAAQKSAESEAQALEAALAKAKGNAQAIAQAARAKSAKEIDAKRTSVEAELSAKMVAAEASISGMKKSAMANVEDIAREAIGAIVEQLTGKAPDAAAIAKAVTATRGH